nr:unnamed protein product [Callosobruchus analis]
MLFSEKNKGLFCIASPNFEQDKKVDIYEAMLNKSELKEIMEMALNCWEYNIFPELLKMS